MGGKGCSNVVAECSIPAYCIKMLGSRHILIGGGGGSAKTGVLNQIQLFLLTYASEFNLNTGKCQPGPLRAQLSSTVDTGEYSNMNMDCIVLDAEPERGRYLIAAGQDQFCALYETTGFCINQQDGEASTGGLAFDFRNCIRIETDKRASGEDSYQKCVRLFRAAPQNNNQNIKMLTAGTDGCIRLWTVGQLLATENRQPKPSTTAKTSDELDELQLVDAVPELEIPTGKSAVEEMDVSPCGQLLATVLPQSTILWALNTGEKLFTLPMEGGPGELISNKFKIRSLRFTGLDRTGKCAIFVTGHNQRVRRSKEVSHLALWSYAKERRTGRLLQSRQACKASISCLETSPCSQFVAFGTMDGSVGIVDTQSLRPLLFLRETHCSFVTALAFLPTKSYDIKDLGRIDDKSQSPNLPPGRCFLPGICASSRAAVVSISVDKRIMVHQLAFPSPSPFTGYLLQISLFAALLYSMFWAIFIYTNH